jgi:hypothetical protein
VLAVLATLVIGHKYLVQLCSIPLFFARMKKVARTVLLRERHEHAHLAQRLSRSLARTGGELSLRDEMIAFRASF